MNETDIIDRFTRHQIYLQRYSGAVVNKIIALLNRADASIVEQLERRLAKIVEDGSVTSKRLTELLTGIREINKAAYDSVGKEVRAELKDLAIYEAQWTASALKGAVQASVSVATPSVNQIASAALSRPFQGRLLREWLSGLDNVASARVRDAIRIGIIEGQTTDQMIRVIRGTKAAGFADGLMEIDRRSAETIVRTATNHAANYAKSAVAADNQDILDGERWTSTLDRRTSSVCRARSGSVYPVGKGPRPPAHLNCRSVMVPVIKDEYRIMKGPGEQASTFGPVSGDETYQSWLKRQPVDFQDDVLGVSKGKLFRKGGLTLDKFVDKKGSELNLSQLKIKEPAAFERAGL